MKVHCGHKYHMGFHHVFRTKTRYFKVYSGAHVKFNCDAILRKQVRLAWSMIQYTVQYCAC